MAEPLKLAGVTVVFDLDGTLVDTAPDLVASLNVCLVDAGYAPVEAPHVQGQIGLGSRAMICTALEVLGETTSDGKIDEMRGVFLEHYAENTANQSRPYPNVITALDGLAAAGATLAICTNKPQSLADTLIKELELTHRFKAIVGSDSVPAHKPDAGHILRTIALAAGSADRAIMIGDSNPDEKAAQNAGLPFIFIPFGYGPIDAATSARKELADYTQLTADFIMSYLYLFRPQPE